MSRRPRPGPESEDEAGERRAALSTSDDGTPSTLVVGLDCRSMNLYRFLRVRFPRQPHGTIRGWIVEGKVTVNGTAGIDSHPLRFGDVVAVDADVVTAPKPVADVSRLATLFADASIVAVDKPAGLATAAERSTRERDLLSLLKRARPDDAVKLVHRIDKHASGVVVFALGREAKRALQQEFSAHRVVKDYLALVSGHVDETPQIVDVSLTPRRGKVSKMVVTPERGKRSVTLVRPLLHFRGYTLVHARPLTGRTHQIRAHLRHLGHSIVADPVYDGQPRLLLSELKHGYRRARGEAERPLLERLALHAHRIELTSPHSGSRVVCSAPLPKDLRSALQQLQKSAGVRIVGDLPALLAAPLRRGAGAADPFEPLMAEGLARLAPEERTDDPVDEGSPS